MSSKMQHVCLGNLGLKVSKIILGCMLYGLPQWQDWVLPEEEAIKHIKYDNGIQTLDTADVYLNGLSEIILDAIKKLELPRKELVIMTKVFSTVLKDYDVNIWTSGRTAEELDIINQRGLNRKDIFDAVKASLKRLQVDYIDLLQSVWP